MHSQTRVLLVAFAVAVAAVGGAFATGVGTAAAQEETEPNPFEDLTNSTESAADQPDSISERIASGIGTGYEYATILLAGVEGSAARVVPDNPLADDPTAEQHAQSFRRATNANSATIAEGLNQHTAPSQSWNTTQVVFIAEDGPDHAVYVLTDVDNDSTITDVRAVNDTERSVDHIVVFEDEAAEDADEIVATLSDGFAEGDKPLDTVVQAKWGGKYCSQSRSFLSGSTTQSCDVTSTYWMDESELPEYNVSR